LIIAGRADGLSTVWLGMYGSGLHWRRQHTDRREAAAIGPIPGHVEDEQDQACTDGRSDDRSQYGDEAARREPATTTSPGAHKYSSEQVRDRAAGGA
jgi:hypothetical protein